MKIRLGIGRQIVVEQKSAPFFGACVTYAFKCSEFNSSQKPQEEKEKSGKESSSNVVGDDECIRDGGLEAEGWREAEGSASDMHRECFT